MALEGHVIASKMAENKSQLLTYYIPHTVLQEAVLPRKLLQLYTVEHRYKEHLIPKHKIRYNHNFVIKELQWNTDITTGCKDRFVITINSL